MRYTGARVTKTDATLSDRDLRRGYLATAHFSLFVRAYSKLVRFDHLLACSDFAGLYDAVRASPCIQTSGYVNGIDPICHAVDLACIWYWKEVLCLQRSAATTCLLKSFGIPAHMILGVQQTPFRAHAWVEANGQVVNDRPYMRDLYQVIDVC